MRETLLIWFLIPSGLPGNGVISSYLVKLETVRGRRYWSFPSYPPPLTEKLRLDPGSTYENTEVYLYQKLPLFRYWRPFRYLHQLMSLYLSYCEFLSQRNDKKEKCVFVQMYDTVRFTERHFPIIFDSPIELKHRKNIT